MGTIRKSACFCAFVVAVAMVQPSQAQVAAPTQPASSSTQGTSKAPYKNTGLNFELGATTFVYDVAAGGLHYNSWSILPEARLRYGFNDRLSISIATGYAGFGNLLNHSGQQQQGQAVADDTRFSPWTYSIAGGLNLRDRGVPGLHQLVLGIGRGNFRVATTPDQYKKGNYVFLGLTFESDDFMIFRVSE
jgi:hypothetical protein